MAATPMGEHMPFAGTLELAGFDLSINRRRVEAIVRAVPHYVPAWQPTNLKVVEVWRGLRPCTPDGLPLLGRPRRWDNVVVTAGHAMIGVSLGPITGQIVAQLVVGDEPIYDLALTDPDRFG